MEDEKRVTAKDKIRYKAWCLAGIIALILSGMLLYQSAHAFGFPHFELKETYVQIEQGEYFDAGAYIRMYSSSSGTLQLPQVDTAQCGRQALIYRLQDEMYEIDRILILDIIKSSTETALSE